MPELILFSGNIIQIRHMFLSENNQAVRSGGLFFLLKSLDKLIVMHYNNNCSRFYMEK